MKRGLVLIAVAATAWVCSAPAQIRDLQDAEDHERAGRHEAALASYEKARTSCKKVDNGRRRKASCSAAYLQRAELLDVIGRKEEALRAYEETEEARRKHRPAAAQASLAAGRLLLDLGREEEGLAKLWHTVETYPKEAFAADALKLLLRRMRPARAEELRDRLIELEGRMKTKAIVDNLLFTLAQLAEEDFDDPKGALEHYDQIVNRYRKSGFYDDSLWHGARLARSLGDADGAAKRLRKLLSTREVAFGVGSYFSVWLDDAQLELGLLLRDDLEQPTKAIKAFSALSSDYPASILRDDALFERAKTRAQLGDKDAACKDLKKLLKKYGDSKYELEAAPKLRSELGCGL